MIVTRTYYLLAETAFFDSPDLAYVDIIRVARNGLGFNDSNGGTPGNREYLHSSTIGRVQFLNPAPGTYSITGQSDSPPDTITVTFKY